MICIPTTLLVIIIAPIIVGAVYYLENKNETTRVLNNNKELLLIHQKVVDKLEQRIAKLEKVLESHAKCIGEMREKKDE